MADNARGASRFGGGIARKIRGFSNEINVLQGLVAEWIRLAEKQESGKKWKTNEINGLQGLVAESGKSGKQRSGYKWQKQRKPQHPTKTTGYKG